jgi:hypothetical protein
MANPIVVVNTTVTNAPTPSTLQKTGALISQGGTTLSVGNFSLLTQPADLTPLLASPLALSTLSWASTYGGQVTATAAAAHGVTIGEQFVTTIAGAVPAGYNGTVLATATSSTAFTYYLTPNPGSETTPGTYTPRNVGELQAMATTFFARNFQQGVYVLELGAGEPGAGVTNLQNFITANPQMFYGYLVPRNWDGVSSYLSFLAGFDAPNAKTYFWTTTTLQNWHLYDDTMKCVVALVEAPAYGKWASNVLTAASYADGEVTATTTTAHGVAPGQYFTITGCTPAGYNGTFQAMPGTTGSTLVYAVPSDPGSITVEGTLQPSLYSSAGIPATEFSLASAFNVALSYDPSSTNKVTPFEYSFLFGVTRFPTMGNAALLTQLKAANINYVGYGGEGGISDNMLVGGNMLDGNPLNFWYAADWMQINLDLNLSNAVINGSNNPINPLYYNQDGINRLEQVAASTGASAITFGMALGRVIQVGLDSQTFGNNLNAGAYAGQLVVNAVPFPAYNQASPGDYKIGKYAGLSMVMTPLRGFDQIVFNLNVTSFAA